MRKCIFFRAGIILPPGEYCSRKNENFTKRTNWEGGKILTRVILVRHARTVWNSQRRYGGHSDVSLDEVGKEQLQKVAHRLKDYPLKAIYASDLERAYQTAQAIAQVHNLPINKFGELREINFGQWEGKTYDEIIQELQHQHIMDAWLKDPYNTQLPQGESLTDLQERVVRCLEKILDRHRDETIAVVTHAGPIWVLISHVLGVPLNNYWRIKQSNTAINIIEFYEENSGIISLLNDVSHLY